MFSDHFLHFTIRLINNIVSSSKFQLEFSKRERERKDARHQIRRQTTNGEWQKLPLLAASKWQRICVNTFNDISFTAPHIEFASLFFFHVLVLVVQQGTIKSKLKSKILMQTISSSQRSRKKKEITIDARRKLNETSSDSFLRFGEIVIMIFGTVETTHAQWNCETHFSPI